MQNVDLSPNEEALARDLAKGLGIAQIAKLRRHKNTGTTSRNVHRLYPKFGAQDLAGLRAILRRRYPA